MRLAGAIVATAVALTSVAAYGDMSVTTFEKNLAAGGQANIAARYFIEGNTEGLAWANTAIQAETSRPLYCPPPKIAITTDQAIDILRKYVGSHQMNPSEDSVGLVLLLAFRDVFPCR